MMRKMLFCKLHLATVLWGLLLIVVWVLLNETPHFQTHGSWPPGECRDAIPPDLIPSTVHRGWPYSFWFSCFQQGRTTVDYSSYAMWWNIAILLVVLMPTSAIVEYALRKAPNRRDT